MAATECNFNFRSQKIETARNGGRRGGGCWCALACSFLRGGKAREADEGGGGEEGDAGESGAEGSQKGN